MRKQAVPVCQCSVRKRMLALSTRSTGRIGAVPEH